MLRRLPKVYDYPIFLLEMSKYQEGFLIDLKSIPIRIKSIQRVDISEKNE